MLDAWRRLDAAKAASPGTTATSSTSAASTGSGDTRDDAPDYRGRRPAKRKGRAFTDIIYLVVSDELRTKMALKLVYPFVAAYVLTVALLVSLLWTLPIVRHRF